MSYCFQPHCQHPQNDRSADRCQSCGATLLLKSRYRILHPLSGGSRHYTFLAIDQHRPSHPYCTIQQFWATDREDLAGAIDRIEAVCEHPQLPDFFASFTDEGYLYLVQDYIDGANLAEELEAVGNVSDRQIRELLEEILPVLQWMHDRHLTHGDLKPENLIRRDADGKLVLVDLGSVRLMTAKRSALSEMPTGSAEYAAPEQLPGRAIPSSDLYSLGAICIRLLTNMSIFELFDPQTNAWMWRSHLKTQISFRLGGIIDRLLQPSLKHRYRSAAEVLADLQASDPIPQFVRKVARWELAATVGAGVAIALTALTSRSPAPIPSPAFQSSPTPTPRLYNLPLRSFPTGTHTLSSAWGSVWSVATSPDGKLLVSGGADGTIQLRRLTPTCLNADLCNPSQILIGHSGSVWAVAVSADGRLLASASEDQTVKLWNLHTGNLIATLSGHGGEVFDVAFSPDSQTLASVGEDGIVRLWNTNLPDGQPRLAAGYRTLSGHTDEVKSVAFLPDGDRLVTGSTDKTVKLWDIRTGKAIAQWEQSAAVWSVAMSPDGRTLATSTADGNIELRDVATGHSMKTIARQKQASQSLVFSPDGQTLASADVHGTIELWRVGTGCRLGVLKQHSGWVDLAFSPDGQALLSGSYDETIKLWQMPGSRVMTTH
jgi:WD40 repeat protein